jgi:hypothetical protein
VNETAASVGWQGSTDPKRRGIRFAPTVGGPDASSNETPKDQMSGANLFVLATIPNGKSLPQPAYWALWKAKGQNRRLFADPSSDSGGISAVHSRTLPPTGLERIGSIHTKNDLSKPFSLSPSCTNLRSLSSSLPLSLLFRRPTLGARIHRYEMNFPSQTASCREMETDQNFQK